MNPLNPGTKPHSTAPNHTHEKNLLMESNPIHDISHKPPIKFYQLNFYKLVILILILCYSNFPKPPEYIEIIAISRENENPGEYREKRKPKDTSLAIPSFESTFCMSPLAEALGECRCPCHLGSLPPIYPYVTMRAQCRGKGRWVGENKECEL